MSANTQSARRGISGVLPAPLVELYDRRWLVAYFVQRQLTRSYRGSVLGFAWALLSPLLMIVLYTLVFSQIIGLKIHNVPGDPTLNFGLYLYCGLLPFMAYSEALNQSVGSMKNNSNLVQKVVFPLEIIPLSMTISSLIDKLFGLGMLVLVSIILRHQLEWTLLLLPGILAAQLIFNLGLSYLFAVIGAYMPDVKETLRALVRSTFFITPILWPVSRLDEDSRLRLIVDLNPLAFLVGAYRDLILEGQLPNPMALLWFSLFAAALCVGGFALFNRSKRRFADLI